MKKPIILLSVALTAIASLGGCAVYDGYTITQDGKKLHEMLGDAPTKSLTVTKMGQPELVAALSDNGECLQYQVKFGKMHPLAIGFDKNGKFLQKDFDTCAGAISRNVFSTTGK